MVLLQMAAEWGRDYSRRHGKEQTPSIRVLNGEDTAQNASPTSFTLNERSPWLCRCTVEAFCADAVMSIRLLGRCYWWIWECTYDGWCWSRREAKLAGSNTHPSRRSAGAFLSLHTLWLLLWVYALNNKRGIFCARICSCRRPVRRVGIRRRLTDNE